MIVHTAALVAFTSFAASGIDAHGTLGKPPICGTRPNTYAGNYASAVDPKVMPPLPGDRYNHVPDSRPSVLAFEKAFKAAGYTDLKEFIFKFQDMSLGFNVDMPKTPECGFTKECEPRQLPDVLEWWGGRMIHDGVVQAYCGGEPATPVLFDARTKFPDGKIPYDKAMCQTKSTLEFYWLAIQVKWQIYHNCVKLAGGGPGNNPPSPGNSTDPNDDYAPPPNNGPPNNGPPNNGPPNNGPPNNGPPNNGPPNNGPPNNGPPHNGPPNNGPPNNGPPNNGPPNNGPPNNRPPNNGPPNNGPPNNGPPNNGPPSNPPYGPPNNGPPSNPYGPPNNAPPSNGPKKPSWGDADQGKVGGEASSPMCKRKMRR